MNRIDTGMKKIHEAVEDCSEILVEKRHEGINHRTKVLDPYEGMNDPDCQENNLSVKEQNASSAPYINSCSEREAIKKELVCVTLRREWKKITLRRILPWKIALRYFWRRLLWRMSLGIFPRRMN